MQEKTITNRLEHIISSQLLHDDWQFSDDFSNDLYLDSLERIQLIAEVEDQFNIKPINSYDLEEITSPETLRQYLIARI